jgi:hypothetical protein
MEPAKIHGPAYYMQTVYYKEKVNDYDFRCYTDTLGYHTFLPCSDFTAFNCRGAAIQLGGGAVVFATVTAGAGPGR